jgi:hypothetical protein
MYRLNAHLNNFLLLLIPLLALWLCSCVALSFGREKNETEKVWKTDRHEIRLYYSRAWAGPPIYKYVLYKKRIFKKELAVSYSGRSVKDDDSSCLISFVPLDSIYGPIIYSFDKCNNVVTKNQDK